MTLQMGVVADDVTGANDIGSMFAKAGYVTHVYSIRPNGDYAFDPSNVRADIVILDTNSRLDTAEVAAEKVMAATRLLQSADCRYFFNKTCSVFRGNIGAEFDAMLDVLCEDFAVVVLGFPKNGRTTVDGVHYVRGVPLAESEFRNDPIHPMTESNPIAILQAQTERKVVGLTWAGMDATALRQRIDQMRDECNYLILDVPDQAALTTIAAATRDLRVLCGSSALGETLPQVWGALESGAKRMSPPAVDERGVLIVAGSLMPQSCVQIEHMRARAVVIALDPAEIFGEEDGWLIDKVIDELKAGRNVVLHSPNSADAVQQTRDLGAQMGLDKRMVGRRVSEKLAQITAAIHERVQLTRLIIAGGETAAAICTRLGLDGMQIEREIQPGLPSCVTLREPSLWLVLKSGSFGTAAFFAEAVEHLMGDEYET